MNSKRNIFGSDLSSDTDDFRSLDPDYSIGGGVVMRRTDVDHGFSNQFGKGPKGWTRSDEAILDELHRVLTLNLKLDASDIEVHVDEGIVILNGWVNSRQEKQLAEDISEGILGVVSVENKIHLRNRLISSG